MRESAFASPDILSRWAQPGESSGFLSPVSRRQSLKGRVERQPSERAVAHVCAGSNAASEAGVRMKTSALRSVSL